MAAVNVTELSDAELRKKLKDLNQNVGPITKSSRAIWEKKLSKLLGNEESTPTKGKNQRRKSTGRVTTAARSRNDDTTINNDEIVASRPKRNVSNRNSTPSRQRSSRSAVTQEKVDGTKKLAMFSSDEEDQVSTRSVQTSPVGFPSPEVVLKNVTKDIKKNSIDSPIYANKNSKLSMKQQKTTAEKRMDFSDDDFIFTTVDGNKARRKSHNFNQKVVGSTINYTPDTDSTTITNGPKDSHLRRTSFYDKQYQKIETTDGTLKIGENFDNSMRKEIDYSLKEIRRSFLSKRPSPIKDQKQEEEEEEEESDETEEEEDEEIDVEFKSNYSYFSLLKNKWTYIILGLFLLILIFQLWLYHYDNSKNLLVLTGDVGNKTNDAINCLFQNLSIKAGEYECGNSKEKSTPLNELSKHPCLIKVHNIRFEKILKEYPNHFEIVNGTTKTVASKSGIKPLFCRISTAVRVIVNRMAFLIIAALTAIAFYFFMKKRWIADDEETRQMLYYVDRIIDTLRQHHAVCLTNKDLPPYLPIPHVRDMLIPLSGRKKMERVWKKAVNFLNSSDSRVRVETQRIAGEDFEVWRWIGVVTPQLKKEKKIESHHLQFEHHSRSWQGPAFEEIEKVVRMPIVPPTPCLKIRYMHEGPDEKDEGWKEKVKNAVLEKCQKDGAEILHIYIDVASKEGCVYVKCDSLDSAGKAFRSMYGNWFDGRLVIVKFVTLARYHQRFPDSLSSNVPLKHVETDIDTSSLQWNGGD